MIRRIIENGIVIRLALMCLVVASLFAFAASPMSDFVRIDSGVFAYIGRGICDGRLPYRDMFDHKGVLLYFLNAFGYSFGYGLQGVWIVESFFYVLSLVFTYKLLSRLFGSRICIGAIIIVYWMFFRLALGGNMTETYAMYGILIAWMLLVQDVLAKSLKCRTSFVVGLVLGAIVMLRPNMIGIVVPYGFYWLWMLKSWTARQAWRPLLFAVSGGCSVLALCAFYLILNGIASDFWECYILFNLKYASSGVSVVDNNLLIIVLGVVVNTWAILITKERERFLSIVNLIFMLASGALILLKLQYEHYYIPFLPTLFIPLCYFLRYVSQYRILQSISLIAVLGLIINFTGYSVLKNILTGRRDIQIVQFKNYINDNSSVLVLGNDCIVYEKLGVKSNSRYFYQTVSRFDKNIENAVLDGIVRGDDKYIIMTEIGCDPGLYEAIRTRYEKIVTVGKRSLWRKRVI